MNKEKWFWIIGHKEMFPKFIQPSKNYWGDREPYKSLKDIQLDLGDRFDYAYKFFPNKKTNLNHYSK